MGRGNASGAAGSHRRRALPTENHRFRARSPSTLRLDAAAPTRRGKPRQIGVKDKRDSGPALEDALTHAVNRGRPVGPLVEKVLQLQLQIDVARDAMLEWGTLLKFSLINNSEHDSTNLSADYDINENLS